MRPHEILLMGFLTAPMCGRSPLHGPRSAGAPTWTTTYTATGTTSLSHSGRAEALTFR